MAQKELEEVVTSALQQETEKVTRLLGYLVFFKRKFQYLYKYNVMGGNYLTDSIRILQKGKFRSFSLSQYFYKKHPEGL